MSEKNKKFRPQVATQTIVLPKAVQELVAQQPQPKVQEIQPEPIHGRAPEQIEAVQYFPVIVTKIIREKLYEGNTVQFNYLIHGKPARKSEFVPAGTELNIGDVVQCTATPTPKGVHYSFGSVEGNISSQEKVEKSLFLLNVTKSSLLLEAIAILKMDYPEDSLEDILETYDLLRMSVGDLCKFTGKILVGAVRYNGEIRFVAKWDPKYKEE